jgi:small-conductance mechanosensitive channel
MFLKRSEVLYPMVSWELLQQNEYFLAAVILLASVLIAKAFQHIFVAFVTRLTAKTESDLDDALLDASSRPIFYLILATGLYFAVRSLSVMGSYSRYSRGTALVVFVIIIGWLAARIITLFTTRWYRKHQNLHATPRVLNIIISSAIHLSALIVILAYFEVEVTPFVAALGLGGLAVGLALQDTLSNFFSGLHIVSDQPFRVGDFIELPEQNLSGYVDDIGWRTTRIRTLPGNYVIVPNSKIAGSVLQNDYLPAKEMSVNVQVGVDYGSDLAKVEKVTVEVAKHIQKTVEGAKHEHEPFIRYHTFGDSNIGFSVILRATEPVAQYIIKHEFIKELHARYAKEKIEISWPVQKLYHMNRMK